MKDMNFCSVSGVTGYTLVSLPQEDDISLEQLWCVQWVGSPGALLKALKRSGPDGFLSQLGISPRCSLAAVFTNTGSFQHNV